MPDWSPDWKSTAPSRTSRRSSPKLNVLNTAVMIAGSSRSVAQVKEDRTIWGRLCESAVGAHLHNTLPPDGSVRLQYWRYGDNEVDFVLSSGRRLVAIEVDERPAPRRPHEPRGV